MCSVNPGSSCVPLQRSLFAPVRPTVYFQVRLPICLCILLFYLFLFYFVFSTRHPRTLWCRRVPSKSQSSVVYWHGFRSPVVESREPPGVGTADGDGVHCSLLDITHVCLILWLLRALILRQSRGQQVLPSAARVQTCFSPLYQEDRHDELSWEAVDLSHLICSLKLNLFNKCM